MMARRADDLAAQRDRRQKIFVAVGGAVLLAIVAFEFLPGVLSSSSSGGSAGAASSAPSTAVAVTTPAVAVGSAPGPKLPHSVERTPARDVFVPLISAGPVNAAVATAAQTPNAPAVRAKHFVVKDPFLPQIKGPSTTIAPPGQPQTSSPAPAQQPIPQSAPAAYIVVIGTIPGKGTASLKAAARAVVAARNAGLKDVVSNNALPGAKGTFTVFTGPYPSAAEAHAELVRALRNGYPQATTERLKTTPAGGF
jgi:hypothetical protein